MITVHIVRQGQFYFQSRWVNGVQDLVNERIRPERARQIIEAAEGDDEADVSVDGNVTFEPGTVEFSFIVEGS